MLLDSSLFGNSRTPKKTKKLSKKNDVDDVDRCLVPIVDILAICFESTKKQKYTLG